MELLSKIEIGSESDFIKVKSIWEELQLGKEMTFFQSYQWNLLLYKQWKKNKSNRLLGKIIVYYSSKIIIPLIIQNAGISLKGFGRKKGIYFLGTGSYSDYLNCIYDSVTEIELQQYFSEIETKHPGYKFYLFYINSNTATSRCFEKYNNYLPEVTVGVTVTNVETYTEKLSKSTRQNLRTALNRMSKQGFEYYFKVFNGILENEMIENLMKIHRERVKTKAQTYDSVIGKMISKIIAMRLDYYEKKNNIIRYAMKSSDKGVTVVVVLDGRIVGYLYGFTDDRTIRIVHNCFDEQYKFFSPMFKGTHDFLLSCCNNPEISVIDFTRGNEEYKYKLGGTENEIRSFVIRNFNM